MTEQQPEQQPEAAEEEFVPAPSGEQGNGELNPGEPHPDAAEIGDDAAVDENGDELDAAGAQEDS